MIGLAIYEAFGAHVLFAFMSVFASLGAVAAMAVHIEPVERAPRVRVYHTARERLRTVPVYFAGLIELTALLPGLISLFMSIGYSSVQNFLTTCGLSRGIGSVSVYFTVCSCAMIATRLVAGRLTDRFGFTRMIFAGIVMMTASLVFIAFAGTLTQLIAAALLYGFGAGIAQPILQALVFQLCPLKRRGAANATYGLLTDIGSGSGSAIWGGVTMQAGYTATYMFSAACIAAGGVFHMLVLRPKLQRFRRPLAQEQDA